LLRFGSRGNTIIAQQAQNMARNLYILDDAALRTLGSGIITKMVDEVKSIFAFAPKFTVLLIAQDKIPEKIDFTDSIVKVVLKDDDVTAMQNQAEQQEIRSIEFAIKKNNLNIKLAEFKRTSAKPERGGVAWQSKDVLSSGSQKAALVQTGGVASAETAATDALTFLAPNNWTLQEAEHNRDTKLNRAKLAHGKDQEDKITEANATFEKSKKHWALQGTAPKNWPQNLQDTLAIALGRLVAHEARHQYIAPHFDEGGLGGEAAELLGVASSEKFHKDDVKNLIGQLSKFETLQKTATIHVETFPQGQAFAFKE
jgi:hypothetical protein